MRDSNNNNICPLTLCCVVPNDSKYPAGQVRLAANVRQHWVGRPHVHHGHRPRLLQRLARRKVQDERRREELQRLFLHVLPHDVSRLYHGDSDSVQVNTWLNKVKL